MYLFDIIYYSSYKRASKIDKLFINYVFIYLCRKNVILNIVWKIVLYIQNFLQQIWNKLGISKFKFKKKNSLLGVICRYLKDFLKF